MATKKKTMLLRRGLVPQNNNLAQGTYGKALNRFDHIYYDRFTVLNSVPEHNMFTTALGGNDEYGVPKTLADTNMQVGGSLPKGQRFTVHGFKIDLVTGLSTALAATSIKYLYYLLADTTVQFKISGQDPVFTMDMQDMLGACTLLAFTQAATGDNIPLILPKYRGIVPINIPIVLSEQTNFGINVKHAHNGNYTSAVDGIFIKVGMVGVLERFV